MPENAEEWTRKELERIVREHAAGKRSTDFKLDTPAQETQGDAAAAEELAATQDEYLRLLQPDPLRMNNRVDLYEHFRQTWVLLIRYKYLYDQGGKSNQDAHKRVTALLRTLNRLYLRSEKSKKDLQEEYIFIFIRNYKDGPREEGAEKAKELWQQMAQILEKGMDGFPL